MRRLLGRRSEQASLWLVVIVPTLILALFFYLMAINNIYSQTYDIEQFNRAKETIRSPITIENEAETERKTREAITAVQDRYSVAEDITEEQIKYIDEIFAAVKEVFQQNPSQKGKSGIKEKELDELRELLSTELAEELDDLIFIKLFQLDEDERELGKETFINALQPILEEGVRVENLHSAREELISKIKFASLSDEITEVLEDLTPFAIVENAFFDVEKTMEARKKAANDVQPIVIRTGDIIVREGQIITKEIYDELKLVGLLNKERKLYPGIGLAIFVLMLSSIIGYELLRLYRKGELNVAKVLVILIISFLMGSTMKLISLYVDQIQQIYLLFPIATGVLLIKLLIYERISIIFAIVFSLLGSLLFNGQIPGSFNIEAGIYFLFFQLSSIIFLTDLKDRVALLKTAGVTSLINVLTVTLFIFISLGKYTIFDFLLFASFGIGAAVLSAVLTIGLLPFFETTFGILSDGKLLSLANPNHPLLRKILVEAPGTYHHSVMVANLSESACEAIGANGLLARVAAYYHDIGKTFKPHYFIENQVGIRNPHDFIEPEKSVEIIISHVTEGAKLLEDHNFPKEIIDITLQHHGTSRVEYFYQRAKKNANEIDEKDFRYPGPRPNTKEAGIISICDATEAVVRSMTDPSAEEIDEVVSSIIQARLLDGQLDDTPLTLKELYIIRNTICEALKGIFHSRIQYPEDKKDDHE